MKSGAIVNRLEPIRNRWRTFKLRCSGVDLGSSCVVGANVSARLGLLEGRPGQIQVSNAVTISQGVVLDAWGGQISIADEAFIGPYTVIYGHGGVTIGEGTLIAMHCCIVAADHIVPGRDKPIRTQPDKRLPIVIGEDVWLGAGVKVLTGVTIGDGCIIGAGAVVTEDLPPYSVAMGVPAEVVRMRE